MLSKHEKSSVEQTALDALIKAVCESFTLDQSEGMASVMFSDIVNSTALADAMGDNLWVATVRNHVALIECLVTEAGGQFIKSLGDGIMSTFSFARAAHEVARNIQWQNSQSTRAPLLQLRIGIHSGAVIQTKDDFFGSVVNQAARVASVAAPGEIRLSEATGLMIGFCQEFHFIDLLDTELRGFKGEAHLVTFGMVALDCR